MRVLILPILFTALLFSCKNYGDNLKPHKDDTKIVSDQSLPNIISKDTQLSLYSAQIILTKGWRLAGNDTLISVGDATCRYRFYNKNGKLIYLQYGLNTIGNPTEPNVQSAIFRKGYVGNNVDTSDIVFTDNPRLLDIRKKSNFLYSSGKLSNFSATFFRPKHMGKGYLGVYIDSIGQIASNIADLIVYADDLDSLESVEFEGVSRSLIIRNFK